MADTVPFNDLHRQWRLVQLPTRQAMERVLRFGILHLRTGMRSVREGLCALLWRVSLRRRRKRHGCD